MEVVLEFLQLLERGLKPLSKKPLLALDFFTSGQNLISIAAYIVLDLRQLSKLLMLLHPEICWGSWLEPCSPIFLAFLTARLIPTSCFLCPPMASPLSPKRFQWEREGRRAPTLCLYCSTENPFPSSCGPGKFVFVILWRSYQNSKEIIPIYHFQCKPWWETHIYNYGETRGPLSDQNVDSLEQRTWLKA